MATFLCEPLDLIAPNKATTGSTVQRTAFYFQSQGEPLFAWLHGSDAASCSLHGVVVCSPVGYEQIHAHRSLRHLADGLAKAGFPVLRLDYHGTGDSAGADENPDRQTTWLANIRDTIAWMQENLGCERISLIGLRIGASLAVQVATDHSVENLILWEPVVKGRRYVREMQALSLTAANQPQPVAAPDLIEAGGFVLTKQTVEDLGRIDLLTAQPKCRRILIVARDDMTEDLRLRDAWLGLGLDVQQIRQPGYAAMMAEPHQTKVPEQAIGRIVNWLQGNSPLAVGGAARTLLPTTRCELPGISERLLHLSQEPDLFGVLSEPKDGAAEHRPLVILTNAGSAYRVGPNRLHVLLSRHLATRGFRVLRLDLCGLGDSVTTDPASENHPYTATAFRDLNLTLKYAKLHLGASRAVLMGLCSGAYVAFQAAASFADPMLVESVLINPLTFFWKDAMTDETPSLQAHRRRHYYWQAMLKPSKWWRLLTGQTQLRIGGAVKLLMARYGLSRKVDAAPAECEPDYRVTDDLERVASADRHLALFISDSDPGYSILLHHAKAKVTALRKAGMLDVSFIPNADHTFSASMRRHEFIQLITAHLLRRYSVAD